MRLFRRIVAALLVVVVAALVGGYLYARPLLKTGTGYAAHNACAVSLVAGRDDPDSDLPDNPLVPFLTGYVNEAGGSATSQLAFTLSTQKAWFTRGFGCTLSADRPSLGEATKVVADTNPLSEAPAPEPDQLVDAAIGRAFGDEHLIAQVFRHGAKVGNAARPTLAAIEAELVVIGRATFRVFQAVGQEKQPA
jgi:hypothetical protein